jgi:hypothetical protein
MRGADVIIGPFSMARALEAGLTSANGPLVSRVAASVNCCRFANAIAPSIHLGAFTL